MASTPVFNPPPGWPAPPQGWVPPASWKPDPSWPTPPEGWILWLDDSHGDEAGAKPEKDAITVAPDFSSKSNESSVGEARLAFLEAENASLRLRLDSTLNSSSDLVPLNDDQMLQNVGIYRYHHPLENAALYADRLAELQSRIAVVVREGRAIVKSNLFTFDNSLAKGRKMADDLGKLMLRAYNSEADNSIRSLRAGNVVTAKRRLERTRDAIAKLGSLMEISVSDDFHDLRVEEIELTADWLMKKQEERESEREHRAQLREEKRVERELLEERERLDKERAHIENALAALRANGTTDLDLELRLTQLADAIAANDFRAANIRAGYVYVISNRGAFGDNVVKIGLTRRLEPKERVYELGGASVPFRFDIHTLYFSEDAVTLENELHKHFSSRALNRANSRKEFFFATPAEVREVLMAKVGNLLEFAEDADATEYWQSVSLWPDFAPSSSALRETTSAHASVPDVVGGH